MSGLPQTGHLQVSRKRPVIAFFDYPDVFEDFYPHYGIDQQTFATQWADAGNHAFLSVLQREIGDVIWYAFSLKPELSEARHEVVGCRVKFFPSSWLHQHLWRLFYLPRCAWRWRQLYPYYAAVASYTALLSSSFAAQLRRDRPDLIFSQDYSTGRFDILLLIARFLGVPLIAYHSGSWPEGYIGRMAKRWTIRRADFLIVSSRTELEMLATRYLVPRDRMQVILTPIDATTFRPIDRDAACRAAGLEPERRYLLFVGRLDDRVKQVSKIISSFASLKDEHPEVDLLIAGNGPDGEMLKQLAANCAGRRVRFLGWISGNLCKANLYSAAECLLLASRSEGFPTVVGEAMACGTPVLGSNVGAISELVVDDQSGWLFAPGDDDGLLARLAHVLRNPELVRSMRAQVRKMAEDRVSFTAVAAELRRCFLREKRS